MLNPPRHRQAVLLLTVILLTSPAAWATGGPAGRNEHPMEAARPASATLLGRAWSLLAILWVKEGCGIDPSGRCSTGSAQQLGMKAGCLIDPSGRCAPGAAQSLQTKAGCEIDPSGRCTPQNPPPQTKAGCGIDPSGRCIP